MADSNLETLKRIAFRFDSTRPSLRPFLQAVQLELLWLPREALEFAAEKFNVSYGAVYEEASLNPEFSLHPRGRHVIAVCRGLSCGEYGSAAILKAYEAALGIREGQTTPDANVTLCTQHCFGQCAVGPNVRVDRAVLNGQDPAQVTDVLKGLN